MLSPAGGSGVPCFTGSARILTPYGYVPIRRIKRGDTVITGDRRRVKVVKLHKFTVPARKDTIPCIIPVGLYGCKRRLLVSPDHQIQTGTKGVMARASDPRIATLSIKREYYLL